MTRRTTYALLALFAVSPISLAFAQATPNSRTAKPNIVVIMADDLGYHDSESFVSENRVD